jgi:hypothetical protein
MERRTSEMKQFEIMMAAYIREELACFSKGMTRSMQQKFGFVNISGGVYHDITPLVVATPYDETFATAA